MTQNVETVTKRASCPVCGLGCQAEVTSTNGTPVWIKRSPNGYPPAECPRSGSAMEYHDHPGRVNYPLKRVGRRGEGEWQRISWDQAIDEISGKLAHTRDQCFRALLCRVYPAEGR
jgi:thiosulfate reductase/polysulfide reductase chain A